MAAGLSGHTSGAAVAGVTIVFTALAALVVFTRLLTRIHIVKDPGLDDGFILAALLFSIATTIAMCLQVRWGMGQHIDTLVPFDLIQNMKAFYVSIWVYNLSMSCTKFSILLQYLRIFPQRAFRIACYALMVIVGIYACWTFFSAVFACWPIATFWNPGQNRGGHCLDRFAVWFANAGMNIATDIAIGILPLPMLKELQLPRRQKFALMTVFGLGGFTCIVSIFRLDSLYVISRSDDPTWQNPLAAIWSSVEINTGMLCSCLPTLHGLIVRAFPSIFASSRPSEEPKPDVSADQSHFSDPSTEDPHQSIVTSARKSLEALGRSIGLKSSCTDNGSDEIKLDDEEQLSYFDDGQIQVVTTLEQEVEEIAESSRLAEKYLERY